VANSHRSKLGGVGQGDCLPHSFPWTCQRKDRREYDLEARGKKTHHKNTRLCKSDGKAERSREPKKGGEGQMTQARASRRV